jgi:rhodanese-related sulfurtransferase
MFKIIIPIISLLTLSIAQGNKTISQSNTVEVKFLNKEKKIVSMNIGRDIDAICKKVSTANYTFWSGDYAGDNVPNQCKSTFVSTSGVLSPMHIHDDIETFAELEVLDFIEDMQEDESMLLVDTRKPFWYEYRTIPTATNISFEHIVKRDKFKNEFKKALSTLGIKGDKKPYDFSKAKTLVLFCNASWCTQSSSMIESLVALGYPHQKLKWYRGGMASWLGLNMTHIEDGKPSEKNTH